MPRRRKNMPTPPYKRFNPSLPNPLHEYLAGNVLVRGDNPVPEAYLEQQPPPPVNALADHADLPFRFLPTVAMLSRQHFGRHPQVAWGDPAVMGVFHRGAVCQGKERRHREHQPVAGYAGRVAAVVELLPEVLAEVVPLAPWREGRGHGVLAGAAGEDGPTDPQYQAGQLWLGEVR